MLDLINAYENHLTKVKKASNNTVSSYMRDIRQFSVWIQQTLPLIKPNILPGYTRQLLCGLDIHKSASFLYIV